MSQQHSIMSQQRSIMSQQRSIMIDRILNELYYNNINHQMITKNKNIFNK